MFLNSVHEQCPNSDPKQCTVTKLGWVHSTHTQNPGRAHTARAVPMSWALLRAQQACHAHVARMLSVHLSQYNPGSLPPGRNLTSMSRHQGSQNHVATSNRCRDTTQNTLGRDLKTGSRHQTSYRQSTQVATSISCRDLTMTKPGRDLKSCRDLNFFFPPRSQHEFHVATPKRMSRHQLLQTSFCQIYIYIYLFIIIIFFIQ